MTIRVRYLPARTSAGTPSFPSIHLATCCSGGHQCPPADTCYTQPPNRKTWLSTARFGDLRITMGRVYTLCHSKLLPRAPRNFSDRASTYLFSTQGAKAYALSFTTDKYPSSVVRPFCVGSATDSAGCVYEAEESRVRDPTSEYVLVTGEDSFPSPGTRQKTCV